MIWAGVSLLVAAAAGGLNWTPPLLLLLPLLLSGMMTAFLVPYNGRLFTILTCSTRIPYNGKRSIRGSMYDEDQYGAVLVVALAISYDGD